MSTALKTDRYELSMLQSFIESGRVNDKVHFEVFTRRLPAGRRFGIFAGLGRLLPLIKDFTFSDSDIEYLITSGIINVDTAIYLQKYKFNGTISAYQEGDLFFPNSPVMTVSGTLGECVLLETLILSVLNADSAIATTAARMVMSAQGRPIIEMGSRRTNEDAAVAAARSAIIAGFAATSNLEAGRVFDLPTAGTAAHAFTLAHQSEREAFTAQVRAHGSKTTLLVDTYDIDQGIRTAIDVAGTSLGAIRIDSGDLANEARKARKLLDELGAYATKITVTSDLDEFVIKDLRDAPIDRYGVGTKLVSSAPMGFVYKLVETNGRPVAKKAKDKVSVGGRKYAWRIFDKEGKVVNEVFTRSLTHIPKGHGVHALQYTFDINEPSDESIGAVRQACADAIDTLPLGEQMVWYGDNGPFITVTEEKRPADDDLDW